MQQNTKDWIQHSSAVAMLTSGVVMAFLSFFMNDCNIKENVLWYIAQCVVYAGSVFGVSLVIATRFGDVRNYIDKKFNDHDIKGHP